MFVLYAPAKPLSVAQQVSILFAVNTGLLDDVPNEKIAEFKTEWFKYMTSALNQLEAKLNEGTAPTEEEKKLLSEEINKFKETMFAKA